MKALRFLMSFNILYIRKYLRFSYALKYIIPLLKEQTDFRPKLTETKSDAPKMIAKHLLYNNIGLGVITKTWFMVCELKILTE